MFLLLNCDLLGFCQYASAAIHRASGFVQWRKWGAPHFRHVKASHWLADGMNIVQISFLLGHEQLQTTMVYLDITTEQEAKALATLEDDNDKSEPKKWRSADGRLASFCGVRPMSK